MPTLLLSLGSNLGLRATTIATACDLLALALGGMREGFSAAELLGAYATFPNGGIFRPARFIRKVVFLIYHLMVHMYQKIK